jgi:hypothetical protein
VPRAAPPHWHAPTPDYEFTIDDDWSWLPHRVSTCTSLTHLSHRAWLNPRVYASSGLRGLDLLHGDEVVVVGGWSGGGI